MKKTYSFKEVLELIKMYSVNVENVMGWEVDYSSVGVATISDMPKANSLSDTVATEALKQVKNSRFIDEVIEGIKYLESRLHKVEGERNKEVLRLRMNGLSIVDIADMIGISRATIYRSLEVTAKQISSNETNLQ